MIRRSLFAAVLLILALLSPSLVAAPQEVVQRAGAATFAVDTSLAFPGGLLVVSARSSKRIGPGWVAFEGKRHSFFNTSAGPRALVPVSATASPGTATLGVEILHRRGRQRIPIDLTIAPLSYAPRGLVIPEHKRHLLAHPSAVRDSRRLLAALRTITDVAHWRGPFRPPVDAAPAASFGSADTYVGGSPVNAMTDGVHGEYHRGLDYEVPAGTPVQAPAAGTVLLAELLTMSGQTIVLDHGQGVLSVFFHLSRIDVRTGDWVEARTPVALTGDTGVAPSPHLHWGTYVGGVAVDPRALVRLTP